MAIVRSFLNSPIEHLKGVGPTKAELLKKELNIFTFGDLLDDYPFRYIDKTQFHKINEIRDSDNPIQVKGTFSHLEVVGAGRGKRLSGLFKDETGSIEVVWFQGIKWIKEFVRLNVPYVLYGKPKMYKRRMSLAHPEIELSTKVKARSALVPVYRSTEILDKRGLDSRSRRQYVKTLLDHVKEEHIPENLSEEIVKKFRFTDRLTCTRHIHYPPTYQDLERARNRIKFEELFFMQLILLRSKIKKAQTIKGIPFEKVGENLNTFYSQHLPFELTNAQKRVVREIRNDVGSGRHMNRLLQGDVGSGKTMVAIMACLLAIDNGFQACVMAPTEILAQQHEKSFRNFLDAVGIEIRFLSGSVKGKERAQILEEVKSGRADILVGTHALIEPHVEFANLGIAIIDEQHRFGVVQRARLWKKGSEGRPPHVLVMTATPIPRTLAMTLHDLDISVIDELPPGRKVIKTMHKTEAHRTQVVKFIREQIALGRQIYIIYPLIEESEKLDLQNLQDGYDEMLAYFPKPDYQIGVVHGRMKSEEKDWEMQRFIRKETQILISTTVIEVGVDVPNATVMIIENAERFGLSQLHQLRGRVGRGGNQSWCILMTSYKVSKTGKERIKILVNHSSGFDIAEADLRMRGPGEIIGTRQSGSLNLKLVNLAKDGAILNTVRAVAEEILQADERLELPENKPIRNFLIHSKQYGKDWSRIS